MSEGSLRAVQQTGPTQELLLSQARGCSDQGYGVHRVPRGKGAIFLITGAAGEDAASLDG